MNAHSADTPLRPGQRVAWLSWLPRRSFSGTIVFVRKNTAQIRTQRADGRTKMRFVKIKRLRDGR